LANTLLTLSS